MKKSQNKIKFEMKKKSKIQTKNSQVSTNRLGCVEESLS